MSNNNSNVFSALLGMIKENKASFLGGVLGVILVIVVIILFNSCGSSSNKSSGSGSGSGSTAKGYHACYVCGENADRQVGLYWYCNKHAAWVEAAADN